MRHVLTVIPYAGKDEAIVRSPDTKILGCAKSIYEHGEVTHGPVESAV